MRLEMWLRRGSFLPPGSPEYQGRQTLEESFNLEQSVLQWELSCGAWKFQYIKSPGCGVVTFVFFSGVEEKSKKKKSHHTQPAHI